MCVCICLTAYLSNKKKIILHFQKKTPSFISESIQLVNCASNIDEVFACHKAFCVNRSFVFTCLALEELEIKDYM